jgi:hypothetical protein
MALAGLDRTVDPQQYLAAVQRTEELAQLSTQVQKRKSMLVHGPEAVGKTRLLQAFVKTQPFALYVPKVQLPRDMLLALVSELRSHVKAGVVLPGDPTSLSSASLKGVVQRALEQFPFAMAEDHPATSGGMLFSPLR